MTLAATKAGTLVGPAVRLEQLLQPMAPDPVPGGANCHLSGLPVHLPPWSDIADGPLPQPTYFRRCLGKNSESRIQAGMQAGWH